jgi:hypothetical protein
MSTDPQKVLARVNGDPRDADRRETVGEQILSALEAFERPERNTFKRLDRRKALRRHDDVRRRIASQ